MKMLKSVFLLLFLCAAAYPQTENLGMGAFANEHGPILLAVDASLADLQLNNPYVFFVVYMAAKKQDQEITVSRNDVVMVYKGQEYHMPPLKEFRDQYSGEIHDIDFYRHLGKEGIIATWVRFYNFPRSTDFFPPVLMSAPIFTDEGYMFSFVGFRTKCYFKNPGFKRGDKLTIKVKDKKNPQLSGEVEVTLE
jgi:hypothetical protein